MKKVDKLKPYKATYLKMHQLIWALESTEKKPLIQEIFEARQKLGLPEDMKDTDPFQLGERGFKILEKADEKLINFLNGKDRERIATLQRESTRIRSAFSLGKEWGVPIKRMIFCGVYVPPLYNIYWVEDKKNQIIHLEINKDTSEIDLLQAWKLLKPARKETFGRSRAFFPSPKVTAENFNRYVKDLELKFSKKYNKGQVQNDKAYLNTDLDRVGEIFSDEDDISEEADRKRLNNLRVNRYRQRKNTK